MNHVAAGILVLPLNVKDCKRRFLLSSSGCCDDVDYDDAAVAVTGFEKIQVD